MFYGPWNPGFQKFPGIGQFCLILTRRVIIPLSFCQGTWFLTQNFKISSFLEASRNFLELWISTGNGQFLPIFMYWVSIQFDFCHWTWQNWKRACFYTSCNFWILNQITSENIKKMVIFRQYPEFQKISGSFREWWNFEILC